MSNKSKCPLNISDWVHYLNARATERGNLVITKRIINMNQLTILIAITTLAFIGITSMITFAGLGDFLTATTILITLASYIIMLTIIRSRLSQDFIRFQHKSNAYMVMVDTIINKIIDNNLKTSDQIRNEWKKTIEEYAKKYP